MPLSLHDVPQLLEAFEDLDNIIADPIHTSQSAVRCLHWCEINLGWKLPAPSKTIGPLLLVEAGLHRVARTLMPSGVYFLQHWEDITKSDLNLNQQDVLIKFCEQFFGPIVIAWAGDTTRSKYGVDGRMVLNQPRNRVVLRSNLKRVIEGIKSGGEVTAYEHDGDWGLQANNIRTSFKDYSHKAWMVIRAMLPPEENKEAKVSLIMEEIGSTAKGRKWGTNIASKAREILDRAKLGYYLVCDTKQEGGGVFRWKRA